jgi:hypothetical protein
MCLPPFFLAYLVIGYVCNLFTRLLILDILCSDGWQEKGRNSSVGIATGYGMDDQGSLSPGGGKKFHFSMSSRPAVGPTQSPIQWVPS